IDSAGNQPIVDTTSHNSKTRNTPKMPSKTRRRVLSGRKFIVAILPHQSMVYWVRNQVSTSDLWPVPEPVDSILRCTSVVAFLRILLEAIRHIFLRPLLPEQVLRLPFHWLYLQLAEKLPLLQGFSVQMVPQ